MATYADSVRKRIRKQKAQSKQKPRYNVPTREERVERDTRNDTTEEVTIVKAGNKSLLFKTVKEVQSKSAQHLWRQIAGWRQHMVGDYTAKRPKAKFRRKKKKNV